MDPTPTQVARDEAERLAYYPTKSTAHMSHEERVDGIAQMLADLDCMAKNDGCIAAAWALEFVTTPFTGADWPDPLKERV